jgi:hypothetical protein
VSKAKNPVNLYISACCNVQAKKDACERTKEERAEKKFGEHGLGTWRCPRCGKKCKVVPQKNLDRNKKQE